MQVNSIQTNYRYNTKSNPNSKQKISFGTLSSEIFHTLNGYSDIEVAKAMHSNGIDKTIMDTLKKSELCLHSGWLRMKDVKHPGREPNNIFSIYKDSLDIPIFMTDPRDNISDLEIIMTSLKRMWGFIKKYDELKIDNDKIDEKILKLKEKLTEINGRTFGVDSDEEEAAKIFVNAKPNKKAIAWINLKKKEKAVRKLDRLRKSIYNDISDLIHNQIRGYYKLIKWNFNKHVRPEVSKSYYVHSDYFGDNKVYPYNAFRNQAFVKPYNEICDRYQYKKNKVNVW